MNLVHKILVVNQAACVVKQAMDFINEVVNTVINPWLYKIHDFVYKIPICVFGDVGCNIYLTFTQ